MTSLPAPAPTARYAPPELLTPAPAKRRAFRLDVEGLRGVAVLLVVLFHAGVRWTSGGFIGVDVFFVLSGYLITGLLVAEHERNGRIGFLAFYARRMRRLLPAATVVLTATAIAGAIVYSPLEQARFAHSATATAAYVSNFWFVLQSADYFSPGLAANPFLHTWSLAVEEQFYLVWPLLLVAGLASAGSRRRLAVLLTAVTVASLGLCLWMTRLRAPWAFFLTPARAWEFGVGGLLSLVPAARLGLHRRVTDAIGLLGVVLLAAGAVMFSDATSFPGAAALVPCLATLAILLPGHVGATGGGTRWLTSKPLQMFGRLSYSWYLWHWPLLILPVAVWPGLPIFARLTLGAVALGAAAVTYRVVERPMREHRALLNNPRRSVAVGACLTLFAVAVGLAWGASARVEERGARQAPLVAAAQSTSWLDRRECTPAAMDPAPRECVFGDSASARVVVAMGDSHVAHWYGALDVLGRTNGWRMVSLIKAGCPAASMPVYNGSLGREYHECAEWQRRARARIAALHPYAVLLSSATPEYSRAGVPSSANDWYTGFRATVASWDSLGVPTVVLRDTPHMPQSAPECLSRAASRPWFGLAECSSPESAAVDTVQNAAALRLAGSLPRVHVADLTDLFCANAVCGPTPGGMLAYHDEAHLMPEFVRRVAPQFVQRVTPLVESVGIRTGQAEPSPSAR